MTNETAVATDPQTSFEEQELDDEKLIELLDNWAESDAAVDTAKDQAKPYTTAVDEKKDDADEALAAVSAHLKTVLEIDLTEETEAVYRAGTYRLSNKHKAATNRSFEVKASDKLKIERAAS